MKNIWGGWGSAQQAPRCFFMATRGHLNRARCKISDLGSFAGALTEGFCQALETSDFPRIYLSHMRPNLQSFSVEYDSKFQHLSTALGP
uniref:Uncharacterized protein n=1 Tax=Candidatus Kentrum sp. FW TaxID=2126338 RepID=A0A450TBM1_9GAMM|nr:MAG: hypothetical protein BECKFW1821C_GA0114237_100546 [Candidatus Kentron sp. FW]